MDRWNVCRCKKQSFDWDAFIKGKIAVICGTEEKIRAFLQECANHDLSSRRFKKAITIDAKHAFDRYGADTTIACDKGDSVLGWCCSAWYKQHGYTVCLYEPTTETKPQSWKLIIEGCGDTTTAKYIEGKKVVASGSVKRYFKDEHSPKAATHAVIEKVFSEDKKEPEKTGFTGRAVCVADRIGFIKGKIYTFENGYTKGEDGGTRPGTLSVYARKSWFESNFVALVE